MIHQWLSFAIPTGQSSTKYNNIFIVEHTPHHTQRGKEFWKRHWAASFSNASSNTEWVFFVTIAILFVFRFRESWKTQAVFVVFGRFSILPHMYPNLQLNPGKTLLFEVVVLMFRTLPLSQNVHWMAGAETQNVASRKNLVANLSVIDYCTN